MAKAKLHDIPFDIFLKYYFSQKDNIDNISSNARYQPVLEDLKKTTFMKCYTLTLYDSDENGIDIFLKIPKDIYSGYLYSENSTDINTLKDILETYDIYDLDISNVKKYSIKIDYFYIKSSVCSSIYKIPFANYIDKHSDESEYPFFMIKNGLCYKTVTVADEDDYPILEINDDTLVNPVFYIFNNCGDLSKVSKNIPILSETEYLSDEMFDDPETNLKYFEIYDSGIVVGKVYALDKYKVLVSNEEGKYKFRDTYLHNENEEDNMVYFSLNELPLSPAVRYLNYMRKYKDILYSYDNKYFYNTEDGCLACRNIYGDVEIGYNYKKITETTESDITIENKIKINSIPINRNFIELGNVIAPNIGKVSINIPVQPERLSSIYKNYSVLFSSKNAKDTSTDSSLYNYVNSILYETIQDSELSNTNRNFSKLCSCKFIKHDNNYYFVNFSTKVSIQQLLDSNTLTTLNKESVHEIIPLKDYLKSQCESLAVLEPEVTLTTEQFSKIDHTTNEYNAKYKTTTESISKQVNITDDALYTQLMKCPTSKLNDFISIFKEYGRYCDDSVRYKSPVESGGYAKILKESCKKILKLNLSKTTQNGNAIRGLSYQPDMYVYSTGISNLYGNFLSMTSAEKQNIGTSYKNNLGYSVTGFIDPDFYNISFDIGKSEYSETKANFLESLPELSESEINEITSKVENSNVLSRVLDYKNYELNCKKENYLIRKTQLMKLNDMDQTVEISKKLNTTKAESDYSYKDINVMDTKTNFVDFYTSFIYNVNNGESIVNTPEFYIDDYSDKFKDKIENINNFDNFVFDYKESSDVSSIRYLFGTDDDANKALFKSVLENME